MELDRYLETLLRKPGALPGSAALAGSARSGRSPPSTITLDTARLSPLHKERHALASRMIGRAGNYMWFAVDLTLRGAERQAGFFPGQPGELTVRG